MRVSSCLSFPLNGSSLVAGLATGIVALLSVGCPGSSSGPGADAPLVEVDGGLLDEDSPDRYLYEPEIKAIWAHHFGEPEGYTSAVALEAHPDGGVILLSHDDGTASFGTAPAESLGEKDIVLTSYDSAGALRWYRRFGSPSRDTAFAMAVADNGDIIMSLWTQDTIDLGGGPIAPLSDSAESILARFDRTGALLWSRRFEGQAAINGIALDRENNLWLMGALLVDSYDLGCGPMSVTGNGLFFAKLRGDGECLVSRHFSSSADSVAAGYALAAGPDGEVTIVGTLIGEIDFGQGPLRAQDKDALLLRVSQQGDVIMSRNYGLAQGQEFHDVAYTSNGDVVIAGAAHTGIDFGAGVHDVVGLAMDALVARLDSEGNEVWAHVLGDAGPEGDYFQRATTIEVDQVDNVAVAGMMSGVLAVGDRELSSAGGNDAFVISYNADGTLHWAEHYGASEGQWIDDIAFDDGAIVVTGTFEGSIQLGEEAMSTGEDDTDSFLARFAR